MYTEAITKLFEAQEVGNMKLLRESSKKIYLIFCENEQSLWHTPQTKDSWEKFYKNNFKISEKKLKELSKLSPNRLYLAIRGYGREVHEKWLEDINYKFNYEGGTYTYELR